MKKRHMMSLEAMAGATLPVVGSTLSVEGANYVVLSARRDRKSKRMIVEVSDKLPPCPICGDAGQRFLRSLQSTDEYMAAAKRWLAATEPPKAKTTKPQ